MQATLGPKRGIETFFFTLIALAIVRVILQMVRNVPLAIVPVANVAMGCLFLGGPLLALCFAARDDGTPKLATKFFLGGLATQISCYYLQNFLAEHDGLPSQVINALGQIALPIWCVGLGALLATLIKDRNIVVPIAIFLAFLDMFLVFSPLGLTHQIIKRAPAVLPAIAAQIPVATHGTTGERVSPGALAGPADFMFLAMFLVALFKHKMRGRLTVIVIIPTLLAYMMLVSWKHVPLPALLPIGGVVLIVNWREFELTKNEKISTCLVTVMGAALFTWGMFQKATVVRVDSSQTANVQAPQKSPSLPETTDTNQP
jgi:hypothetical protein